MTFPFSISLLPELLRISFSWARLALDPCRIKITFFPARVKFAGYREFPDLIICFGSKVSSPYIPFFNVLTGPSIKILLPANFRSLNRTPNTYSSLPEHVISRKSVENFVLCKTIYGINFDTFKGWSNFEQLETCRTPGIHAWIRGTEVKPCNLLTVRSGNSNNYGKLAPRDGL